MVTLVSIKLTGESNIIDDNPTMKQADEMSRQFIRDPNNLTFFYFLMFSNRPRSVLNSWFIQSALHCLLLEFLSSLV